MKIGIALMGIAIVVVAYYATELSVGMRILVAIVGLVTSVGYMKEKV
jgi:hypothetical protein